ncbi:hypothetical protein CI109_104402 [Kwoniella shandongensis]|uniref:Uncharacterized protein n=1 Tax=Kwoniella shandongensis TaxID=1734106 RepID=A0A5M6BWX0_9TREE|nr:uncharacterized protein CI109_004199 [Kwoniella shandongensis]KAA5527386.1 hypothetical protein CI109_004199 [Kwoniella shandongensis]
MEARYIIVPTLINDEFVERVVEKYKRKRVIKFAWLEVCLLTPDRSLVDKTPYLVEQEKNEEDLTEEERRWMARLTFHCLDVRPQARQVDQRERHRSDRRSSTSSLPVHTSISIFNEDLVLRLPQRRVVTHPAPAPAPALRFHPRLHDHLYKTTSRFSSSPPYVSGVMAPPSPIAARPFFGLKFWAFSRWPHRGDLENTIMRHGGQIWTKIRDADYVVFGKTEGSFEDTKRLSYLQTAQTTRKAIPVLEEWITVCLRAGVLVDPQAYRATRDNLIYDYRSPLETTVWHPLSSKRSSDTASIYPPPTPNLTAGQYAISLPPDPRSQRFATTHHTGRMPLSTQQPTVTIRLEDPSPSLLPPASPIPSLDDNDLDELCSDREAAHDSDDDDDFEIIECMPAAKLKETVETSSASTLNAQVLLGDDEDDSDDWEDDTGLIHKIYDDSEDEDYEPQLEERRVKKRKTGKSSTIGVNTGNNPSIPYLEHNSPLRSSIMPGEESVFDNLVKFLRDRPTDLPFPVYKRQAGWRSSSLIMASIDPKPVPIDFTRYLSKESTNRKRSQLKELRQYSVIPGMISFGVGSPHPSTWPVNGMTLSIPFAGKSVFIPGYDSRSPNSLLPLEAYSEPTKDEPLRPDLSLELQYSSTYGTPHLLEWIKEHIERVHKPQYNEWTNLCTAGNTDGVDGIMRACFDKGEYMLTEEFAYPGLLSPAASIGLRTLGVPMDAEGVRPDALEEILANWDEDERGGARPKMIVIVPTCSNPSGVTIPVDRKREIYAVCRKWDLLICEDDPYCFLQIRPNGADSPIVPSFLSLDTDGRVLRVDSFSKIVAPGSRLGFITGHKVLVEKIMQTRESATQCPSGFSIAAISAILRAWGSHGGFETKYIPHISDIYSKRCLSVIEYLKNHVPPSTIEIPSPSGGMFLWVRLKIESHPTFLNSPSSDPETISKQVFQSFIDEKILIAPSEYFRAPSLSKWSRDEEAKRIYVRISFALPPPKEMEEGAKRMGRALAKEWQIPSEA